MFIEKIEELATAYLEYEPKSLTMNLAIEIFKSCRNYPKSYSQETILADMQDNISKIAMAVVEIDAKDGVENQTAHNENGISRTYANGAIPTAYSGVIPIANFF